MKIKLNKEKYLKHKNVLNKNLNEYCAKEQKIIKKEKNANNINL